MVGLKREDGSKGENGVSLCFFQVQCAFSSNEPHLQLSLEIFSWTNRTALPALSESRTYLEIYLSYCHLEMWLDIDWQIWDYENPNSLPPLGMIQTPEFPYGVWFKLPPLDFTFLSILFSLLLPSHPPQKPLGSTSLINLWWLTVPLCSGCGVTWDWNVTSRQYSQYKYWGSYGRTKMVGYPMSQLLRNLA